jgi:hypothetical protein
MTHNEGCSAKKLRVVERWLRTMSLSILTKLEVAHRVEAAAYLVATPPFPAAEPPGAQAAAICREARNCGLFRLFAAVTLRSEPAERIGRRMSSVFVVEEGTTRLPCSGTEATVH